MSISPLNFNGMIQNTNEISHTKANEDSKSALQQANLTVSVEKQKENEAKQVNDTYEAKRQEGRYDREGDGKGYEGNKNRPKNQQPGSEKKAIDGKVLEKGTSSFDMRI
ncbi:MAG: hypothetical protein K5773_02785 [Pseudobutyrivibrio sp.]|nr:hypothetical protein [Pseudobutyrivibrio sp.]